MLRKTQLAPYQVLYNRHKPETLVNIHIVKYYPCTHRSTIISNDCNYMLKDFVLYVVVQRKQTKSCSKSVGGRLYWHDQPSV